MTDTFCDSKMSNVASSPQRLSGPLHVVELDGPRDDKFDASARERNWHSNRPRMNLCVNRKLTNDTLLKMRDERYTQIPRYFLSHAIFCSPTEVLHLY